MQFPGALDVLQDILWDPANTATFYRGTTSDRTVYKAVAALTDVPCRRHTTSNFDRSKAGGWQSNQDSFDTSDGLEFALDLAVRAGDVCLFDGEWLTVAGDPQKLDLLPLRVAFVTTTTEPNWVSGAWS